LKNTIKDLKHQPTQANGMTAWQYLFQRGTTMAKQVLNIYLEFGRDVMRQFGFEIHATPFMTLSSLSFKCVWLKYCTLAGPFHHALEKTKLFYEDILRDHSHGGFAFSCKSRFNCGDALYPSQDNSSPTASSIMEYDISSSYGFAVTTMNTPTGFCCGYVDLDGEGILERCDLMARHKTFEFQSVYATLFRLVEEEHVDVAHVFSNFHSLGICTIAGFPLDLVVITRHGRVKLFQYDGQVMVHFFLISLII
jgi:hypothetical protein